MYLDYPAGRDEREVLAAMPVRMSVAAIQR
jgi:hypothetical protein